MRLPNTTALCALMIGLAASGCAADQPAAKPAPPEVGVVTLKEEAVTVTDDLPGRVVAFETSEVRPQISGIVRRRLFTEGGTVRAGQVLYEIEDAPYRATAANARGQLARAEAAIDASRLQAERYRDLVKINAVSKQESENADAAARQARADVVAMRAALDGAQVNLGFTHVRAPISGRIGRSLFTPGTLVQAGQAGALATIQRTDKVYLDLTQSAADVITLREAIANGSLSTDAGGGLSVRMILPNGKPYAIEGRLQFADVSVDETTGAVTLRAIFPNPDGILLPGMYARAQVAQGVARKGLLAPQKGITRDERGRAVALVVNAKNVVEQRPVQTDRVIGDKWLISSGLRAGDRLIVDGLLAARPGTTVTPRPPAVEGGAKPAAAKTGN